MHVFLCHFSKIDCKHDPGLAYVPSSRLQHPNSQWMALWAVDFCSMLARCQTIGWFRLLREGNFWRLPHVSNYYTALHRIRVCAWVVTVGVHRSHLGVPKVVFLPTCRAIV